MASVEPKDREEHGMEGGSKKGKYPVANEAQAKSAIKLRHHGKGTSAGGVLSHVMSEATSLRKAGKISPAAYNRIKAKVAEARKTDSQAH